MCVCVDGFGSTNEATTVAAIAFVSTIDHPTAAMLDLIESTAKLLLVC